MQIRAVALEERHLAFSISGGLVIGEAGAQCSNVRYNYMWEIVKISFVYRGETSAVVLYKIYSTFFELRRNCNHGTDVLTMTQDPSCYVNCK